MLRKEIEISSDMRLLDAFYQDFGQYYEDCPDKLQGFHVVTDHLVEFNEIFIEE